VAIAPVTASANGSASFGSAFSAAAPPSIVSGNLLVAIIYAVGSGGTFVTPSGWTLIAKNSTANYEMAVFTKTATGSEPSTYPFNTTNSAYHEAVIAQYSGTTGLDGTPVFNQASAATANALSVTPTAATDYWVVGYGQDGNWTVSSAPSGLTLRASDVSNPTVIYVYDKGLSSTAPTGNATLTWASSTITVSVSLLLAQSGPVSAALSGPITSVSSLTATLPTSLVAQTVSNSSLAATLNPPLRAPLASTSTLSGTLSTTSYAMNATLASLSSLVANLTIYPPLVGAITSTSTLASSLAGAYIGSVTVTDHPASTVTL
jgi:hypothetical protein